MAAESNAFMSVHFLPSFIEVYKSHPCLWKTKGREYGNKFLKDAAYRELLDVTRQVAPSCDLDFIKKKIDLIRGSFRREHKKVQASKGGDAVHYPKLWYYNSLLFLADQEERPPRNCVEEAEEEANSREAYCDEQFTEDQELFEQVLDYPKREMLPASCSKRPRLENQVSILTNADDEYELFGKSIAAQLRNMDAMQSIYAQHVINQVLFKGKLHKLEENTTLSNLSVNSSSTTHSASSRVKTDPF